MKLSGGKELAALNRKNASLGALSARIIDAFNHMAAQIGVDPVGQASSPPPPNGVSVTVTGEMAHVRVLDNNPTDRARSYWAEVHGDPSFTTPLHVEHMNASRDATLALPTMDSGGLMKAYYVRAFSQTKGSPPSPAVSYPTYVTMDGTTQGDVPASSGSGTTNAQGTQSGEGFGQYPTRKQTGVKRSPQS